MISRIDLRGQDPGRLSRTALAGVLPRAATDVEAAVAQVRPLCDDVRRRGAEAVRDYTARFDGVDLATTRVPREAQDEALAGLDPAVRAALEEAIRRTRKVHRAQLPGETTTQVTEGLTVTGRFVPVGRAGVYVPGGLVAYPSSVVMNIVPAQVAGVGAIAVASPPQAARGGLPHPSVLAACALLGVHEVHAAGGAQALAMFAYGTRGLRAGDVITGPGNVYVAAAKRVLRGVVGTDGEAGPDRGGDHRRRHRGSPPRRRRPGCAGRTRRARGLPAHHYRRSPGRQRSNRADQAGRGGQASRAGRKGAARPVRVRAR